MTKPTTGPQPQGSGPSPSLLSDGYGDGLTVDEQLAQYDAWLHRRAHQMLSSTDHRHDDLVQEGRIAMWEALQRHDPSKGSLPAWLTKNATWQMRSALARRDGWTGRAAAETKGVQTSKGDETRERIVQAIADHKRETGASPSYREIGKRTGLALGTVQHHMKRLHLSPVAGDEVRMVAWEDVEEELAAPDVADGAMLAYHRGQIAAAVEGLTESQRRYVRMRFWDEATVAELTEAFGYDPRGLWRKARGGAQPKLCLLLGHLEEAA